MDILPTISSKYRVDIHLKCSEYAVSGREAITLFLVTLFRWEKQNSSIYEISYLRQMYMLFVQQSEWPIALATINFSSGLGGTFSDYLKGERGGFFRKLDQLIPSECRKEGLKIYCKQKVYNLCFKSANIFSIYLHFKEISSQQNIKSVSAPIQSQLNDRIEKLASTWSSNEQSESQPLKILAQHYVESRSDLQRNYRKYNDSGQYDSVHYDSGHYNSGHYDSGHYDSGYYDSKLNEKEYNNRERDNREHNYRQHNYREQNYSEQNFQSRRHLPGDNLESHIDTKFAKERNSQYYHNYSEKQKLRMDTVEAKQVSSVNERNLQHRERHSLQPQYSMKATSHRNYSQSKESEKLPMSKISKPTAFIAPKHNRTHISKQLEKKTSFNEKKMSLNGKRTSLNEKEGKFGFEDDMKDSIAKKKNHIGTDDDEEDEDVHYKRKGDKRRKSSGSSDDEKAQLRESRQTKVQHSDCEKEQDSIVSDVDN